MYRMLVKLYEPKELLIPEDIVVTVVRRLGMNDKHDTMITKTAKDLVYKEEGYTLLGSILEPLCTLYNTLRFNKKDMVVLSDASAKNAEAYLAKIIAPTLIRYQDIYTVIPVVDDNDVPIHLKGGEDTFKHEARWNYVLDTMIYAFEYSSDAERRQELLYETAKEAFPNNTKLQEAKFKDDLDKVLKKVHNGHRLFGKYYKDLWT